MKSRIYFNPPLHVNFKHLLRRDVCKSSHRTDVCRHADLSDFQPEPPKCHGIRKHFNLFKNPSPRIFTRSISSPKTKKKNRDNTHIFQTSLHIPNRPGPIQLYYSLSSITLENLSFSLSLCKRSHRKLCPPPIRKILPKPSQQQQAVRARNCYPGISNPS
jgi:hypothetical protein